MRQQLNVEEESADARPKLRKGAPCDTEQREVEVSAHGQAVASHGDSEPTKKQRTFFFKAFHKPAGNGSSGQLQTGANRNVTAEDLLQTSGDTEVRGERVGWEESLGATCDHHETSMQSRTGSVSDLIDHDIACPEPRLLSKFRATSGGSATQMKVDYRCCKFSPTLGECVRKTAPPMIEGGDGSSDGVPLPSDGSLMKLAQDGLQVACDTATALQRWKLYNNAGDGTQDGSKIGIEYWCCPVGPGGPSFGDACEDDILTSSAPEDDNVQALFRHDAECPYGMVMSKWKMVHSASNFHLQFSCCPIGETVAMGPEGSCSWVGDPHFTTFDKYRHDPMVPDNGFYWVVKSDYVQVQSYYQGRTATEPMRTRGIAVAGKFLMGNKLIVKFDVAKLRGEDTADFRTSGLPTAVCWNNEECVTQNVFAQNYMNDEVSVVKLHPHLFASFPLGVTLKVHHHGYWSDQTLTMKKPLVGTFDGECGNFNQVKSDESYLQNHNPRRAPHDRYYIEDNAQNMFLSSYTGAPPAPDGAAIEACPEEVRGMAETMCNAKFRGTDAIQLQFKKMCILDLCNTAGEVEQMQLAAADEEAANEAEMVVDFASPRKYEVKERTGNAAWEPLWDFCTEFGMKVAKPNSPGEQRAVMEAVSQYTGTMTDHVLIGIEKQGAKWKWIKDEADGTGGDLCAGGNWASGQEDSGESNVCIKVSDGKWYGCSSNGGHHVVCEEDKKYGILSNAGPTTARSACGEGKQLAMPKTPREISRMHTVINDGSHDIMFVGGSHVGSGVWQWDDGTQVCGGPDIWETSQPDTSHADAQYYLCVSPVTGKFIACEGNAPPRPIVCETKHAEKNCPLSKQDLGSLGMSTNPSKRSRYQDRCYYLSQSGQNCDSFCPVAYPGSICDQEGLTAIAETPLACQMIIAGFGLETAHGAAANRSQASDAVGCTYLERSYASGTVTKKQMLEGPSDMPLPNGPKCDRAAAQDRHIPCACKDASEASYPDGWRVTPSNSILWSGELTDAAMSETFSQGAVGALMENGTLLHTDNVALKLEFIPATQIVKRSYHLKGVWHDAEESRAWPFSGMGVGAHYSVKLTCTATSWQVTVMGHRIPSLDFPREVDVPNPDSIQLEGAENGHVSLITQPAISSTIPVSMNSENGCLEHPFEISVKPTFTVYWSMRMTATDGLRCIRCEASSFIHGSNIYLQDGKLVLTIEGNAPRTQEFDYDFHTNTNYVLAIHYLKTEKVVELYVNQERVDYIFYTVAGDFVSGKGDVGCFNGEDDLFAGAITDLVFDAASPKFRPFRDRCTVVSCPGPELRRKVGAFDFFCGGSICDDTRDQAACCDTLPKCNPAFTCPQGSQYKVSAGETFCQDADCRGTQVSHCCDAKNACTTFECPPDKIHVMNVGTTYCNSTECGPIDESKCCENIANCSTLACDPGFTHKPHALSTKCSDRKCSVDDADTCCARKGMCTLANCPVNMRLRDDANITACDDPDCSQTSWAKCCVMEGRCDSHTCPNDKVLKDNANTIYCNGRVCGASDIQRCCEDKDVCSNLQCQAGWILIGNAASTLCSSRQCEASDHSTCCEKLGLCSSYECPPAYRLKPTASSILCDDVLCETTDYHKCCGLDGMCSTYVCPPTYVHKLTASIERCDGFSCTNADLPMCCDRTAQCSTHMCPPTMTLRVNHFELFCQGRECSAADDEYCCIDKGLCTAYACPVNTVHKQNAQLLRCAGQLCEDTDFNSCCVPHNVCTSLQCPAGYRHRDAAPVTHCAGQACATADRDLCCKEVSDCSSYQCPGRYFRKPGGENLFCESSTCTHGDLHTCCQMEGFCTNMTCPLGWLHKPAAHEILCDDKQCLETPTEKCCAVAGKCNSYHCPDRYVMKFNASAIDCKGWLCDIEDRDLCCDAAMSCSQHECPHGSTLRLDHADRVCHDRYCTGEDHETCCVEVGHCHSYGCPEGYLHRHDENLLCSDANCSDTEYTVCCAPEKKCNTYQCPDGFVHKDGSERIDCAGLNCTDADRDTCCDGNAACTDYTCPAGLTLKALANNIICEGSHCADDERLTCCTTEGRCDSLKCPPGFQHRHDANDIFCEDASCQETDYHICCVEEGHCHTYHCPTEYVHKINASITFCEDWLCRESDRETCCDLRAHCNEEICPVHTVQRYDALDLLCTNRTCQPQDYDHCCTSIGMCSSRTCPPGYTHRLNANEIECEDQNCTATDFHICCAEEDMCHSYSCPDEFLHRPNAEHLECQGFVCDDTDRDTCCIHQAWCNTYVCDSSYALKSNAAGLLCENTTCLSQDRDICCDHQGTCLLKDCPPSHLHKPNAQEIVCSDMRCLNTDVDTCCQRKALCLSKPCPDGYALKDSVTPLYCAGFDCVDADRDTCCDRVAPCNEYEPPHGYFLKHNAVNISCQGPECSDVDLHICTGEAGMCSSYVCPESFIQRHDARHIQCEDLDCLATEYTVCCAKEGHCDTWHCPDTYVHRSGSANISCSNETCSAVDDDTCCQLASTCNTYLCDSDFTHRKGAANIYCAQSGIESLSCTDDDQHSCCVQEGRCSTFPCPSGFLHRHNAHEIFCDDENCSATSYEKCCAEEGKCPTYTCPQFFVAKNFSEGMHCRDMQCTDADKYGCCDETASCQFFWCPEGYQWKNNIHLHRCEGRSCDRSVDVVNCCKAEPNTTTVVGSVAETTTTEGETTTTVAEASTTAEVSVQSGARRVGVGVALGALLLSGIFASMPIVDYDIRH